ncbi:hypothetical protein DFH09DRAFT_560575 [Mycena vulgaris]|nr:hypothetical protein DFH09DRAFT_560575 [Mycena vulgaris]
MYSQKYKTNQSSISNRTSHWYNRNQKIHPSSWYIHTYIIVHPSLLPSGIAGGELAPDRRPPGDHHRVRLADSSMSLLPAESLLPNHIAEHGNTIQQIRRPSHITLLWPKLLLFPPLPLYTIRSLYASRASIVEMAPRKQSRGSSRTR